jgi:hypothetical protein
MTATQDGQISTSVGDTALAQLHALGYAQELCRRMGGFSNFAVSFTIISVLSRCLTLYYFGMTTAVRNGPCGAATAASAACPAGLGTIDAARAAEGVVPMSLPTNFGSLTGQEQIFVLADPERVDRGLAPIQGLASALDADAQSGAADYGDPPLPSYGTRDGANWGESANIFSTDDLWMYQDGWGGGWSGYWMVSASGGVFSFGDAAFHGSAGALRLNRTIVGMAATLDGGGYWLVASDGGIFNFGNAGFYGSTGAMRLNYPLVGLAVGQP